VYVTGDTERSMAKAGPDIMSCTEGYTRRKAGNGKSPEIRGFGAKVTENETGVCCKVFLEPLPHDFGLAQLVSAAL
jgi:hypothetical protein|tara:strand:+ start:75 stop:302 length:228 start_codon:yes stop_codon:yes gene_type:complete